MKIDRQLGILSILLQKDSVTAPYLSEVFEVSRRTINRDIEDLCKAGIPITTRQGTHGGISILANYKLDRTMLTRSEMQDILAGLRSLDSVNGTNRYGQLMEKLSVGSSDFMVGNQSILIDLSSWYKDSLAPKIELVRMAIDQHRVLNFLYYSPEHESSRQIEPYYLIFRWSDWYVWGWCQKREAFRLFKLNRMVNVQLSNESFSIRTAPLPDLGSERIFSGGIRVKVLFEADCKWRLVEEFGPNCFQEQDSGKLLFQADFTNHDYLISWLLAFGDQARLLEPEEIREELRQRILRMNENMEVRN